MDNFGTGVARVLDPTATSYIMSIWQQGKPPTDYELNLSQQLADHNLREVVGRMLPSGFLGNETSTDACFETNPSWSNWFKFGRQETPVWAVVNGWILPIVGTRTGTPPGSPDDTSLWNKIALDPPPSNAGESCVDFVFLEVWKAKIAPNPATTNKPSASGIWKYGNVESGMSYLADDIKDPAMGFETTQRVQIQYRIRVASGIVGLSSYPDGFDPTIVKAKGAYLPDDPTAETSFTFTNMGPDDPGLWRAGDGTQNALGTVDGYVYAIPIAIVFRRNSAAWNGEPSQNLNGAQDRNPDAVDRTGAKTFAADPTLTADISDTAMSFDLSSITDIALPLTPATGLYIRVDDEIMTYTAITGTTVTISARGALGTKAEAHKQGATVSLVNTRPDGLFADQVAATDIYDVRHIVNPNGFSYETLLQSALDKLARGYLRSTWKYTGSGPQGTYVPYQDVIGTAATLGVTKLDAADNIRQVFSDAAFVQKVETVVQANSDALPADVNVNWTLDINVKQTTRQANGVFSPANTVPGQVDTLVIPIAQFKNTVPGADQDQIRFVTDGSSLAVTLRIDGMDKPLPTSTYTVSPGSPESSDDLTITLNANFPAGLAKKLFITFHVLYGPGRGLSRRPHSIQNIAYYNPGADIMTRQTAIPTNNVKLSTAWAPTWTKYNGNIYDGVLPTTAESYADLGSKTVILNPFRRIVLPTTFQTEDGSSLWHSTTPVLTGTQGTSHASNWDVLFNDATAPFGTITPGMRLEFFDAQGVLQSYAILAVNSASQVQVDKPIEPMSGTVNYSIYSGEGYMPTKKLDGTTSKWTLTDPLDLFSGTLDTVAARKNLAIEFPRHLIPTWGAVYVPIRHTDTSSFDEGINFLVSSRKGATLPDTEKNYVPYGIDYGSTWASQFFTTYDFGAVPGPATYNTALTISGQTFAGIRKFTDTRGLGRKGLELPPFYGIARLYGVYEVEDFKALGSPYNATTRAYEGSRATNLLRQDFDGPVFWIELDEDGDSTFILNADAIDTNKCPNSITFDSGEFVIEASIFGFDRGTFAPTGHARIVLARERNQANDVTTRTNNVGWSANGIDAPICVLPAPPAATDKILVNYSRTPYQGDPWGSQSNNIDQGYLPGPLTTSVAWQLVSTDVNEQTVVIDNPKQFEVLASTSFVTTLGTGRMSGIAFTTDPTDATNPGSEVAAQYPPASISANRPRIKSAALTAAESEGISASYVGATAEFPLGALFRDKDFKGGLVGTEGTLYGRFIVGLPNQASTTPSGHIRATSLEQNEVLLGVGPAGNGALGEVLFYTEGNTGNYSSLTTFRTTRGGAVYTGNGSRPGGAYQTNLGITQTITDESLVLVGKAHLVRNRPTSNGAQEVSAGDELMLLVVTSVMRPNTQGRKLFITCGSNGSGEGIAAAEIYRLEGHPLVRNYSQANIDGTAITLASKIDVEV